MLTWFVIKILLVETSFGVANISAVPCLSSCCIVGNCLCQIILSACCQNRLLHVLNAVSLLYAVELIYVFSTFEETLKRCCPTRLTHVLKGTYV